MKSTKSKTTSAIVPASPLDRNVNLKQPMFWSRVILLSLVGVTTSAIIWASVAQIDEAVPAFGKLETVDPVKDIKAPIGGVVQEVFVKEGQEVNQGDLLLKLDTQASLSRKKSLSDIRNALLQENQYYTSQMVQSSAPPDPSVVVNLAPEVQALTQNRAALVSENELFRAIIAGGSATSLSSEQLARLNITNADLEAKISFDQLQITQLREQLSQVRVQLQSAIEVRDLDEQILKDFTTLAEEGALARVQKIQQQQKYSNSRAEVLRLRQEEQRLIAAINQAEQKTRSTFTSSAVEFYTRIAENEKRIAEIDSQLNKLVVENAKRIAEIDSQLAEVEQTIRYQNITAPVRGTVFNLKARTAGFVINSADPILQIVPSDQVVASVFITNQNIGFVRLGMTADVRIDTFPSSEFGDVKGEIIEIGSEALPPDNVYPFFRFPAKVRLEDQFIKIDGKKLPLQPGMSLSANIKIRKRSVTSLLTDLFTKPIESLETIR